MNLKWKLMVLALSAGTIALQLGSCARWFGDVVADTLWLRTID